MMRALLYILTGLAASACTTNLGFNAVEDTGSRSEFHEIPRRELADQGSGEATSLHVSGNHTMERATAGGNYSRRHDASSPNYKMNAGVHDQQ
jgi:hypothetical protein